MFWVAYQLWTSNVSEEVDPEQKNKTLYQLAKQEFLLAIGNPKAILIFTAFLPQFVDPTHDTGHQFFVLGTIFLCLEWVAITIFASVGIYLRYWFSKPDMRKLFNRGCAALIGIIGVGLLVERKS
ncbi:hypothetical protein IMCC1989_1908 [gamma proteobacterium IMCC1989]|nr:hypothetical protein IMCC1989_1908 [gamma proteobacterium IMCC1989]